MNHNDTILIINLTKIYRKAQRIIQGMYLFLFIFLSIGICGNIELGEPTSTGCWIVYGIVAFLSIGKIIYSKINGYI